MRAVLHTNKKEATHFESPLKKTCFYTAANLENSSLSAGYKAQYLS